MKGLVHMKPLVVHTIEHKVTTDDIAAWFVNSDSGQQAEILTLMVSLTHMAYYNWSARCLHITNEFTNPVYEQDHSPTLDLEGVKCFLKTLLDTLENTKPAPSDIPPPDTAEFGTHGPPYGPEDYM